jgi:lipopolysaccharide assembly outer membrane protein LptD (OstA)
LKIYFYILFIFFISGNCYSQIDTSGNSDTLRVNIDTSRQVVSDIDQIIDYASADSVIFDIQSQKIYLYNKAVLLYKDLKLNSGVIIIDRNTQVLESYGIPDTLNDGKFTQTPIMIQGKERYEGTRLTYSFKTGQGTITSGYSDAEVGYYIGERIKKVTPEVFFIKNGLYTTSTDKEDPEYYFYSPKMKIIPKDKVIAQSVFLYIEGVPVFWIPFAVFPDRAGRSSGLIVPTYGNDATYGVYFAKMGYFWAMSDYTDINFTASIFTKGRFDFNSRFRYALKYNFSGEFNAGLSVIRLGEDKDVDKFSSTEWQLALTHNQQINPTTSLSGNLNFLSGKSYYDNNTNNLNDLLRQNAVSNLTLSKYWEETPFSMSLNYYRDQNLTNGDVNENIPSLNFNITQTYPFRAGYSASDDANFYEYIGFSYNGSGIYNRYKRTVQGFLSDSTVRDERPGVQHNISINYSPKTSYVNFIPFFSYTEKWYSSSVNKYYDAGSNSVITENVNGFKAARYFSMGVSMNTKFVGIFKPNVFGITGIRHTVTPAISYVFTPDFSSEKWGYYKSYTDASGREVKYSVFENGIFGGTPFGESQSLAFTMSNLFEMKTKVNDTLDNKFQLFNLNAGINYNFAADSLKWSDLRLDFRTQIGGLLNFAGGATFNLYKYDNISKTRINQFLFSTDGKLADLTNVNFNISSNFNFGIASFNTGGKDSLNKNTDPVKYNIPISGGINYNFSESRPTPEATFKSSNINGNISFSFSEKWKFSFTTSYDLINKQISAPYITAYRDLNSWEMDFSWYPSGFYRGFKLEIRIKAPQLKDIKVTKQTNPRGVYE